MLNHSDVQDLMKEIGQILTLELPGAIISQVNHDLGISAKSQPVLKQVQGYTFVPTKYQELAITGGNSQEGGLMACLSAKNLPREDLKPGARLISGNVKYTIAYLHPVMSRGVTIAHLVRLTVVA